MRCPRFPTSDFGAAQCISNRKAKLVLTYSRQTPSSESAEAIPGELHHGEVVQVRQRWFADNLRAERRARGCAGSELAACSRWTFLRHPADLHAGSRSGERNLEEAADAAGSVSRTVQFRDARRPRNVMVRAGCRDGADCSGQRLECTSSSLQPTRTVLHQSLAAR